MNTRQTSNNLPNVVTGRFCHQMSYQNAMTSDLRPPTLPNSINGVSVYLILLYIIMPTFLDPDISHQR